MKKCSKRTRKLREECSGKRLERRASQGNGAKECEMGKNRSRRVRIPRSNEYNSVHIPSKTRKYGLGKQAKCLMHEEFAEYERQGI